MFYKFFRLIIVFLVCVMSPYVLATPLIIDGREQPFIRYIRHPQESINTIEINEGQNLDNLNAQVQEINGGYTNLFLAGTTLGSAFPLILSKYDNLAYSFFLLPYAYRSLQKLEEYPVFNTQREMITHIRFTIGVMVLVAIFESVYKTQYLIAGQNLSSIACLAHIVSYMRLGVKVKSSLYKNNN